MVGAPRRRNTAVVIAFAATLLAAPSAADAHPLHTSFASIAHDKTTRTLVISLRVFMDDYSRASIQYRARPSSANASTQGQSPLISYALANFHVSDDAGRPLALVSCGGNRSGDLLLLCFKVAMSSPPKSLRVSNTILFEVFKDQINVVQATLGPRKSSALFSPGDGSKQLR
ncbi:MAG: DUF6702 family protein [Gemmatimonadales bacterium]